ncbi:MAG: hypothetical protein NWE99_01230 [Candidatus Bathyarchaeota archaeon]|nr:hypothetical protein [Candidatus Bathyarchaeota archaeon]
MTTIVDLIACALEAGQEKKQLRLIFKDTYGREPTSEELQTFKTYLRLIGAWH